MSWRDSRRSLVVGAALLVSLAGVTACARNPPPATQAPAASGKTSDASGQQMAGLTFDPQGADFTLWINRFKDEAYRNWIVPEAAQLSTARGHVDFEFTVERDGSLSKLKLLKSTGTESLDHAAQNALASSHFLVLPHDYGPKRVTMQVSFHYNDAPR